ncbi:MAG: hypothetical protein GXP63_00720 [DPANN group archaeon]|nr:hypothetical protein [DPANN group archaeon]
MTTIQYQNCLGTFIFTKDLKLIKHDAEGRDLASEYGAVPPDKTLIPPILEFFRDPQWLRAFHAKGIALAKASILADFSRDQLIITTIAYLDDLSKVSNMLTKRLRDAYYEVFPEPAMRIRDNGKFVELVATKSPAELRDDLRLSKDEVMEAPLRKGDWERLHGLAVRVHGLYAEKEASERYLDALMTELCPNMLALTGSTIGARLLQLAGSLKKLSIMPATTVQVLGAETAMFRHMRNKRYLPPKYGILHEHPAFASTPRYIHGKIARALADRIAIAAKVDYFKGKPVGEELKEQFEKRLAMIIRQKRARPMPVRSSAEAGRKDDRDGRPRRQHHPSQNPPRTSQKEKGQRWKPSRQMKPRRYR